MSKHSSSLSRTQLSAIVVLRILIGWYFLYEGVAKLLTPGWSSYAYLVDSQGLFAPMFNALAQNQALMPIIDWFNIIGLTVVGLALVLGVFERTAAVGGMLLLLLYYFSHPALIDVTYIMPPEGSYLWINKNIVLLGALLVIWAIPTADRVGLRRMFRLRRNSA